MSSSSPFPVDSLPATFALTEDEKTVIQTAFQWLSTYRNLCHRPIGAAAASSSPPHPAPAGTLFELWSMLTMVYMLAGSSRDVYPMSQVWASVSPPPDFVSRIGALIGRLEGGSDADAECDRLLAQLLASNEQDPVKALQSLLRTHVAHVMKRK